MFVLQGIFIRSLAIKCEQQIISWRHLRVAYCLLDSIILPNTVIQMARNRVGRGRETEGWRKRERKTVCESSCCDSGIS